MKFVRALLGWTAGVLFVTMALVALVEFAWYAVASFLIAAAVCLPPLRQRVFAMTGKAMPWAPRLIIVLVALVAGVLLYGNAADRAAFDKERDRIVRDMQDHVGDRKFQEAVDMAEPYLRFGDPEITKLHAGAKAALTEEAIAARQAEFESKRSGLISQAESLMSGGSFRETVVLLKPYLEFEDPEIQSLHDTANARVPEQETAERTQALLAELKQIPVESYSENLSRYRELAGLHPGTPQYQEKIAFYEGKIEEREAKQAAERRKREAAEARKERIESQFSGWDGSHRNLERLIKSSMNDPDSYDHVETVYWDRGDHLIVQTRFRGANAFGGIVIDSVKAKVSLSGSILAVIEE